MFLVLSAFAATHPLELVGTVQLLGCQEDESGVTQLDDERLSGDLHDVDGPTAQGAAISVLHVEVARGETVEDASEAARCVLDLNGNDLGNDYLVALMLHDLGSRSRTIADDAEQDEVRVVGDNEGVNLYASRSELAAETCERARAVGKADGELIDEHGGSSLIEFVTMSMFSASGVWRISLAKHLCDRRKPWLRSPLSQTLQITTFFYVSSPK